jgi:hypothetical protein
MIRTRRGDLGDLLTRVALHEGSAHPKPVLGPTR